VLSIGDLDFAGFFQLSQHRVGRSPGQVCHRGQIFLADVDNDRAGPVLSADEIKTVWDALPTADMRDSTRRVIRLCLVTAQRVGEVAGMTHAELDLEHKLWTIPPERAKNGREHVVPLSSMALEIIGEQIGASDAQARRKGRPQSQCVFPAPRGARDSMAGAAAAKALKKAESTKGGVATILGVAPFTPHDLRRSAATHMEELGVSPFIIAHLLNQFSATKATITSRVYARYDYAKEKREALDLWSARLAGLVAGNPVGNVVAIGRKA
jgi:integrase